MIKFDCSYMQNRVVTSAQIIKVKVFFLEGSPYYNYEIMMI